VLPQHQLFQPETNTYVNGSEWAGVCIVDGPCQLVFSFEDHTRDFHSCVTEVVHVQTLLDAIAENIRKKYLGDLRNRQARWS